MSPRQRRYDNSGRSAQAGRTRERILDATLAELARGDGDLSLARIAASAGVAMPTVYRHFPNRTRLMEALQPHINIRLGRPPRPRDLDSVSGTVEPLFDFFEQHETVLRAFANAPGAEELRAVVHGWREQGLKNALSSASRHLAPEERRALRAVVLRLMGWEAWLDLRDNYHVSTPVAKRTVRWAVEAILDRLRHESRGDS